MAIVDSVIKVKNLNKSFEVGTQKVPVLHDISFSVKKGDFLVIFGPSGCGKSTLLHSILGLEEPSSGEVVFLGENLYQNKTEDQRADFRKSNIGMVYQQPNWVKSLSVIENVAFPLLLLGKDKKVAFEKAIQMLKVVGMGEWADYLATELSSGQQQRVALARALIVDPKVIIADEPTGNLDFESGQTLMELLQKLNKEGKTIIMVTHDLDYMKFARSSIKMLDGQLEGTYSGKAKTKLEAGAKHKRGDNPDIERDDRNSDEKSKKKSKKGKKL